MKTPNRLESGDHDKSRILSTRAALNSILSLALVCASTNAKSEPLPDKAEKTLASQVAQSVCMRKKHIPKDFTKEDIERMLLSRLAALRVDRGNPHRIIERRIETAIGSAQHVTTKVELEICKLETQETDSEICLVNDDKPCEKRPPIIK